MSEIKIQRAHQYSIDDLTLKINDIKKDIERRFGVRSEWDSDQCLLFRSNGISGSIVIDDVNFKMTLKLSMMYRMMSNEIEKEIVRVIDKYFY